MDKIGPKFVLDHMMIYQMLADEMLWERVPEMLTLKDDGEAAHHKIVQQVILAKPGCKSCSTIRTIVKPFQTQLGTLLEELHARDDESLDNLVKYISVRRGYRPVPILVYYVSTDGAVKQLEL